MIVHSERIPTPKNQARLHECISFLRLEHTCSAEEEETTPHVHLFFSSFHLVSIRLISSPSSWEPKSLHDVYGSPSQQGRNYEDPPLERLSLTSDLRAARAALLSTAQKQVEERKIPSRITLPSNLEETRKKGTEREVGLRFFT